ncbi:hypothetical protein [Microbacterium sp.]|uniref:hypothetical protein n=1 Tax=Microbacterium sp. TaxID=51671 RepID=UPI003A9569E6
MNKKTQRQLRSVVEPPDRLPDAAHDLWPDISKWPTEETMTPIISARDSRPEDYRAVLNGLRWCTTADISSAWSLLAAWLGVVGILLATLAGPYAVWALWTAIGFGIAFTVMLGKLSALVQTHHERKRNAIQWLAALDSPQSPRRPAGALCRRRVR